MDNQPPSISPPPQGYADWLAELKTRIHIAQQRATLAVNRELVAGSAPPWRAAMVISRMNLPVACDFRSEATSRLANNH